MDLYNELQEKITQLDASVKALRKTGEEYAEAEMNYKVALSKKCLELKDNGTAISMLQLIAYGLPDIARLRFQRDCKEAIYKANQESINSIKLQIRILDNQLSRELGSDISD